MMIDSETSAILSTLIESAKRHGLDPYILFLLKTLPAATTRRIPSMTPVAIAKSKRLTAPHAA